MESENSQLLLQLYRNLTNEFRYRLIIELSQQNYTLNRLAYRLTVNGITVYEGTVLHHLKKLQQLDIVRVQQTGNTQEYQLNTKRLELLAQFALTQKPSLLENFSLEKLKKLQSLSQPMTTLERRKALAQNIWEQEKKHGRMLAALEEEID